MNRHCLGLALLVTGQPLAWIARAALGAEKSFVFPAVIICLAILLTANIRGIVSGTLRFTKRGFLLPLVWLIAALILALTSVNTHDKERDPIYTAAIWAALLAINSVPVKMFAALPRAMMLTGLASCAAFLIQAGLGAQQEIKRLAAGDSDSPNQMAFVALITVAAGCTGVFSRVSERRSLFLGALAIGAGAISLLLTNTRSTFIAAALSLSVTAFVGLRRLSLTGRISSRGFGLPVLAAAVGVMALAIAMAVPSSREILAPRLEQSVDYMVRGYEGYVGGAMGVEESAETRRANLLYVLEHVDAIGHGYREMYVDCPLVQSFWDGGVILGVLYALIALIIPLWFVKNVLLSSGYPAEATFCCYLFLVFAPNVVLHGMPYDYPQWFITLIFYGVVGRVARQRNFPSRTVMQFVGGEWAIARR